MYELVQVLADQMQEHFHELKSQQNLIGESSKGRGSIFFKNSF